MGETCDVEYAGADGHRIARPKCTRPKGHRDDSTNCYSDPDGCHYNGSMWWTNKHTQPSVPEHDGFDHCPGCQAAHQTKEANR